MTGRGKFITLEGGEGAGKSTQARRLAGWLAHQGLDCLVTREPGGSRRAEVIRDLLLSGTVAPFGPYAEALFFAVARSDHMAETIAPALAQGRWVICDRFMDSTLAYQGTAGVEMEELLRLEALAVGTNRPDLTLILDVPAETGLARLHSRAGTADRFERDTLQVHELRREAFRDIARRNPDRCVLIDASGEEDAIADLIASAVENRVLSDSGLR